MEQSVFTRIFPVPRVLSPHICGFDLSNESIKLMSFERKGKSLIPKAYGEVSIPSGVIVSGEIKKREALVDFLRKTREKFSLQNIAVSLPEERSYIFDMSVPVTDPAQLHESIELQLEGHIPISPGEVVFDYEVISHDKDKNTLLVNVCALPKNIVESYLSIFEEVGLTPRAFEVEATAAARAVIPKDDTGVFLLVDFGNSRTSFSVVTRGHVSFNAILDFGGKDITEAIVKYFNVSFEEAEKLKIQEGVSHSKDTKDDIFAAAFSPLAVLKDEVNKYYAYWNDRVEKEKSGRKIEKILFTGGSSALSGLSDFLANYFDVPFTLANPWTNVISIEEEIPPIHKNDALRYAIAIGLALRSYQKP